MNIFKKAILNFNEQLMPAALKYSNLQLLAGFEPDAVIIVGMGGSGQIGDLINRLASELKIPVPVLTWKDYDLPKLTFKNPFYIFISFSGNTEETLSGFVKTKNKAVVCSGGKLEKLAEKNKSPLAIFLSDGLAPRQATGYMFYGAMGIIKKLFPGVLLPNFSKINPATLEKTGKKIAKHLTKELVLVYTTSNNNHLAYNWKTRLNETAKHFAFANSIPEISHNEIVPFEKRSQNSVAIFLTDSEDHPRNQKKIRLVINILKKYGVRSLKISLPGKTRLEKTWKSLILADWTSYHLALLNKINPLETKLIDQLKELMK